MREENIIPSKTPSNKMTPFFIFRNEKTLNFLILTRGIVIQYNENQNEAKNKDYTRTLWILYATYTILENRASVKFLHK